MRRRTTILTRKQTSIFGKSSRPSKASDSQTDSNKNKQGTKARESKVTFGTADLLTPAFEESITETSRETQTENTESQQIPSYRKKLPPNIHGNLTSETGTEIDYASEQEIRSESHSGE